MGEYAKFRGEQVKIGTCEDMYYLRADQARLVVAMSGNVDPVKDAGEIRFRFPFPDEDTIEPGHFDDYGRALPVSGVAVPDEVEHYTVQFSARAGYLVSLPCPESGAGKALPFTVHRNGFAGAVLVSQQRLIDGKLVLICDCGGCGAKWRLPTLAEALPVIEALTKLAEQYGPTDARHYATIAQRALDGYTKPNPWTL